jgi:O-antigen ligase/tetratricopeptide (TPR) repeat protein
MSVNRIFPAAGLAALVWLLLFGATYNGLLTPTTAVITAGVVCIGVGVWAVFALTHRHTAVPGDYAAVFGVWAAAIALSFAANPDHARRSLTGIAIIGMMAALFATFSHLHAAGRITRRGPLLAVLVGGAIAVLVGLAQAGQAARGGEWARIVSVFGNANTFAAWLVVLLPLIGAAWLRAADALRPRRFARVRPLAFAGFTMFAAGAVGALLLTGSRGGFVGAGAAVFAFVMLVPGAARALQAVWGRLAAPLRGAVLALAVLGVLGAALLGAASLADPSRALGLRMFIYETALAVFREHPLFGRGVFTFGAELAARNSTPFTEPHSHAHNLILNVAAEMGAAGLFALGVSAAVFIAAVVRARRLGEAPHHAHEWVWASAAAASAIGFAAHSLLDMPIANPAVGLAVLIVLWAAASPLDRARPEPRADGWGRARTAALGTGWAVLLVALVSSTAAYTVYMRALTTAAETGAYAEGAAAVARARAMDPYQPVYAQQQGMLSALSAWFESETVADAAPHLRDAAAAFTQYTAWEPEYAIGWANLGALYAALGDTAAAADTLCRAAALAPGNDVFWWRCGEAAEAVGDRARAADAYARALAVQPDLRLYPTWAGSPVRAAAAEAHSPGVSVTFYDAVVSVAGPAPLTPAALADAVQAVLAANSVTLADPETLVFPTSAREQFMLAWFYAVRGDAAAAETALARALPLLSAPGAGDNDRAWAAVARSGLADAQGDTAASAAFREEARALLEPRPLEDRFTLWANIGYIQFLRLTLPRQFVPQLAYPPLDGVITALLDTPTFR